jgi:hypothetical protein
MNIKPLLAGSMSRLLTPLGIVIVAAVLSPATTNAQTILYSTVEDFAQFSSGTGVTSTDFFSVDNTVNGAGNTTDPGGAGTTGSLQLALTGGWQQVPGGTFSGPSAAALDLIAPGSSGSNIMPASGTVSFDLNQGDLTSWWNIYLWVQAPGQDWWGSGQIWQNITVTSFTGADGGTWLHYEVPYSITGGSGSLSMGFFTNSDSVNVGAAFYIDNIQVAAVPEPATTVMLLIGSLSVTLLFRRRDSARFSA